MVLPPGAKTEDEPLATTDQDIAILFGQLTELKQGESKRDTARLVAERLGLTTKVVYDALERAKITRG